jgi:hypothetical protein
MTSPLKSLEQSAMDNAIIKSKWVDGNKNHTPMPWLL